MQVSKTLLLTAFEPFGGRDKNASLEALKILSTTLEASGSLTLFTRLLPVETERASALVCEVVDELKPDIVLCTGEAKRDAICLEQVAYNERHFTIPDNSGKLLENQPIIDGAPSTYASTLALDQMLEAMEATGVPVRLSDNPGRFLCNEVLYSVLHHIARHNLTAKAGFVHVPLLPEVATESDYPSLSTAEVVKGIQAGILSLLGD